MKALKAILTGAILTAVVGSAEADVIVHITGSTAYRTQTHLAIAKVLGGAPTAAYNSGSLSGASKTWFKGTIASQPSLGDVTIKCAWSGAVDGTATVAKQANAAFLPNTVSASSAANSSGSSVTGGTQIADATVNEPAEVAMVDQFQASTPFTSPTLVQTKVGVIAFEWVLSESSSATAMGNTTSGVASVTNLTTTTGLSVGQLVSGAAFPAGTVITAIDTVGATITTSAPATATGTSSTLNFGAAFSNVTPALIQALFKNGAQPKSLFTNNPADTALVYPTGRDPFSGTRVIGLAESGVGANFSIVQHQILATATDGTGTVTSLTTQYPATVTNGAIGATLPRGGETGGGNLANLMGSVSNDSTGYAVTYLGTSDAATAVSKGAHRLTWNGVPYSLSAVQNGQYTFWSYEHLAYRSDVAANIKSVADAIANQLINVDATIKLSTMRVQRSGDGTVVTP